MGGIGDAVGDFASGAGDFLFGSEKTAKTRKIPRLTPEQMDLLNKLTGQVSGQIGEGVDPYSGELAAGPSGLQEQLFSAVEGQGGEQGGLAQMLQQGQQMATGEYDPSQDREYWREAFVEPAQQQFQEETLPGLREQFAGQGALSSGGFNRAVADAAAEMNTNLGSQLAQTVRQGRQQDRQFGLQTVDSALAELDSLMQVGQQQRGIEQEGLQAEFQKWQQSQPYNNPWLQQAGTAMGVSPYQIDTYTHGGGSGLVGQIAPAAAQAGTMAMMG